MECSDHGVDRGSIWVVTFGEFEQIKEILWWAVEQIYDMYNGAAFWLYSINLLLSMVSGIVIIYLVICLGQLANRHRVLCSVGYYVAYLAVNQVIRVGSSVVTGLLTRSQGDGRVEVILSQGAGIFFSIVYIVAAVLVSHYIISRKLNLE